MFSAPRCAGPLMMGALFVLFLFGAHDVELVKLGVGDKRGSAQIPDSLGCPGTQG